VLSFAFTDFEANLTGVFASASDASFAVRPMVPRQ
jgi:hypothetical protein